MMAKSRLMKKSRPAGMKKRLLSLAMALSLMLGMLPSAAFAGSTDAVQEQATKQLDGYYELNDAGNITGNELETSVKTYEDGNVVVEKEISATGTENLFDITLRVKTTETQEEMETVTGADVVLVFDVSTSMDDPASGRHGPSRWSALKDSATTFIHSLLDENPQNRVSIVVYGGSNERWVTKNHAVLCDWTNDANKAISTFSGYQHVSQSNCSRSETSLRQAVFGDDDTNYGATNCQAGFWGAGEMLAKVNGSSNAPYVVYMSDGATNRYYGNYSFHDGFNYVTSGDYIPTSSGNDNNSTAVAAAKAQTTYLKQQYEDLTIYTIGFGLGENGNNVMSPNGYNGNKDVDRYVPADDADELELAYGTITNLIKLKIEAWTVTDPMGDNIVFEGFADQNEGDSIRSYDSETGTILWNVKKDIPEKTTTTVTDGNKTTTETAYQFELTYRVRLDTTASDFVAGKLYPTNGNTILKYVLSDENGNIPDNAELKEAKFAVPVVKGYLGDLSFTKKDPAGNTVNGVTFTLTCKDCEPTHTVVANAVNGRVSFAAEQGKGIPSGHTYTLSETQHNDYQALEDTYEVSVDYGVVTVTKNGEAVSINDMTIVNKHNPEEKSLTITKAWLPAGQTPSGGSVTVALYSGDTLVQDDITISAENNWTTTLSIPTVDENNGNSLVNSYTVKEVKSTVPGSEAQSEAFTVTYNSDSKTFSCTVTNVLPGEVEICLTKQWVDGKDSHPGVTLGLFVEGKDTPVKTATLSDNKLSESFTVDRYDMDGNLIQYYVAEQIDGKWVTTGTHSIDGVNYVVSTNGYTVTNTIAQENSVTISGHKDWVDGNNTGNIRPASVTVSLYADGKDTGLTAETSSVSSWAFTFDGSLPKYAISGTTVGNLTYGTTEGLVADGHEIEYTVVDSVTDYTMTSEGTADNDYTVTNTRADINKTQDVTITKVWEDDSNADGTRPDSVTLILQRSSNGVADADFNDGDRQNTFDQGKQVEVNPANPNEGTEAVYEDEQTYTFAGLPVYDSNGYQYVYTVKEEGENNYKLSGNGVQYTVSYDGTTVTNFLDEGSATTAINVHKKWIAPSTDGLTVTVNVVKNRTETVATYTLDGTEDTPWTYQFTNLPVYDSNGEKINYTVEEEPVTGYTASIPVEKDGVWYITNTIAQENTSVSVEKTWDSGTATVPASLTVTLYADDIEVGTYNLTSAENWKHTFENLPKYAIPGTNRINDTAVELEEDGHAIRYTVEEAQVPGYTMTHSSRTESVNVSYQFTNTFDAGSTDIQVNKLWKDPGNSATRPESVWVGLFADGEYVAHIQLTKDNNWSGTFTDLPVYSDVNDQIEYTVREMASENDQTGVSSENIQLDGSENTYTVTIVGGTITNTMEGDVDGSQVVYSVNKVWNGPISNAVSFGLYANATDTTPIQVIKSEDMVSIMGGETIWSGTFNAVPKYDDNGQRINYVVKEIFTCDGETMAVINGIVSLDGISYTASSQQSGNTIIFTNTVNETNDASFSGVKHWVMDNAPEGVTAPTSIQVELYADDVATGKVQTVTAEDNWAYEWTGLQRYNSETHMPIVYSVREVGAYGTTTLDAEGTIQQTVVKYGNNYFTVEYAANGDITNTYLTRDEYKYRVDRIYNYYVDGTLQSSDTVTGTLVSGEKGDVITDLDTDSYKTVDNKSNYTYVSGTPTFTADDETVKVGVTLSEPGEYVITLTYEYRYTSPGGGGGSTYYTVTVNYYDQDTGDKIATSYSDRIREGRTYDVSAYDAIDIEGYTYVETTGDALSGTMNGNKVINVYYSSSTDIEDPDVPGGDLPDPGDGDGDGTDPGDGIDITDPEVPGGDLPDVPETGDNLMYWVMAAAVSGLGVVWLAITGKKRKDETEG